MSNKRGMEDDKGINQAVQETQDKLKDSWHACNDLDQVVETGSLDKLSVSWRQNGWWCKLIPQA